MALKPLYMQLGILLLGITLFSPPGQRAYSKEPESESGISGTWILLQGVPNITWTSIPQDTHFAFDWEVAPILYSFGMNKRDSRWHFFIATQPERFTGSVELIVSAQVYTRKVKTSHWGFSGQLVAHVPLVEYGEYLGLNIGVARYAIAGSPSNFIIGGFSTFFGFLHYNIKYSPGERIWMNSLEFRFF